MIGIQSQQILVPKSVYIGDTAELRCTFNYNSDSLKELTQNGEVVLSTDNFLDKVNFQDYEIKNISIIPAGVDFYQLTITFVPWKTGEIQFPSYLIDNKPIEFDPVNIVSITEQNSITSLKDSTAPLLLPGTTYKLYSILIVFILLLILIIRCIVRHEQISFYMKNQKLKRKYKKNVKNTQKKLMALSMSALSSKEIASEIQKIMRNYLEVRFEYPFTKAVTSELMRGFLKATGGLLPEEKNLAFQDIVCSFIRTDFIRYSENADFQSEEKDKIVANLIEYIAIIETPIEELEEIEQTSTVVKESFLDDEDDEEDGVENYNEDKKTIEDVEEKSESKEDSNV